MSGKNRRSVLLVVAAATNALLSLLLLLAGIILIGGLIYASLIAGNESWASLGARAAAELGEEFVGLLELFGIDAAGLLEEFAASQGLPAFDRFAQSLSIPLAHALSIPLARALSLAPSPLLILLQIYVKHVA